MDLGGSCDARGAHRLNGEEEPFAEPGKPRGVVKLQAKLEERERDPFLGQRLFELSLGEPPPPGLVPTDQHAKCLFGEGVRGDFPATARHR